MTMRVACPGCRARYSVPESASGKKVRCKKCGQPFLVRVVPPPAPAEDSPQVEGVEVEPSALPGTTGLAVGTDGQGLEPRARSVAAGPLRPRKVLVVFLLVFVLLGAVAAVVLVLVVTKGDSSARGQVSEANFRKLKVEMTLADVEAILGQGEKLSDEEIPPAIEEHITPEVKGKIQNVEPQRWRLWHGAQSSIFVGLSQTDEGDRVSVLAFVHGGSLKLECGNPWAFRSAVAAVGNKPDQPAKKALTRENYAKLKKGMTEKEVFGILGPPTSNRVLERHAGFVSRQIIWQLKQAYIITSFHNGRLEDMDSGDGNGGPLPSEKQAAAKPPLAKPPAPTADPLGKVSPDARGVLEQCRAAHAKLKTLAVAGTITVKLAPKGEPLADKNLYTFSALFNFPSQLRIERLVKPGFPQPGPPWTLVVSAGKEQAT